MTIRPRIARGRAWWLWQESLRFELVDALRMAKKSPAIRDDRHASFARRRGGWR